MFATGIQTLDEYLGGGLLGGILIELSGASGVGKTQLAYTIIREVLARNTEACAIILQSEGTCAVERLAEICQDSQILSRVMIEHVDTKETLMSTLVEKVAASQFDLVLIDSIGALYRFEESYVDRGLSMLQLAQTLKQEIGASSLILCINQVTRDGASPALGLTWSNCVNIRLHLRRSGQERELIVLHHPLRPKKVFYICLAANGFVE